MNCPGLHCPGCSEGQSLGILGATVAGLVIAAELSIWVAEHIWEIGGTLAACFALSVAASMWLETRADRRSRAWGAARGIYSRADVVLPAAAAIRRPQTDLGAGETRHAVADSPRPAIAAPPNVTFNIYGRDGEEAAVRIIRQALAGQAGGAITEGGDES